ncbi:MFS transporter [Azospirillum griseum]|uniref:MFS transporter n=2 Tax=Azospirillum griseum TaxID=2496639 RepID=A0A431VL58_9PROT|nr:MFS transporter [Azospirillum griseum]
MQGLDEAIIATSLPQMATSFGVTPTDLSVGITAYLLATAACLPISGWLADRFGARRIFAGAIVLFTLASLACALSTSLTGFALARLCQGVGGALMGPVGRLVVLRSADKTQLMGAVAIITWPALTAPVLGPALGGFITTHASWPWIFLMNLPLGLIGLALVLRHIPNSRATERAPLDRQGVALTATALVCLLGGLDGVAHAGADWGEPATVALVGLATGWLAVAHLRRAPAPLLDLRTLDAPSFAIATLRAGTLCRVAINATPFLLPLLFQLGFGWSAWQAGTLVLVYFAGNLGMKTVTTPILRRWGFRTVLTVNGALCGGAIIACGFLRPDTPLAILLPLLLIAGMTRSLQFTGMNTLAFADIDAEHRASAATLSSLSGQMAVCLGVALAAFLLERAQTLHGAPSLGLPEFRLAFAIVGVVGLSGALLFLRLTPNAGAEVSGHRR